jgi:DNA-dependent RNA polymerase auxiliary subunit epsilon
LLQKQNTLADINFNIEFINLISVFFTLLSKTGSESTALTASAT